MKCGVPIEQAVEGAGTDVEIVCVVVVELIGVEPIRSPEEGEEKNDVGIGFEGYEETFDLGPSKC